jgi:tetratricopeptide (TPR) repeat protein
MSGYDVTTFDDLESLPGPGTLLWRPIRRRFGLTAFGINAYTASQPGQDVVEDHTERSLGHEEVYVVVQGHATFSLDGEEHDAPAGTMVVIRDPSVRRGAKAVEPGTTVLAIGGKRGNHETSRWEYGFAAYGYAANGDPERGVEEIRAGMEDKGEDDARLQYDLACLLCLAGRPEEAREPLRRALELDPKLRDIALEDDDLAEIRDAVA